MPKAQGIPARSHCTCSSLLQTAVGDDTWPGRLCFHVPGVGLVGATAGM